MTRVTRWSCLLLFVAVTAAADEAFDPAPWLADFAQLRAEMSSHYSGLQWQVASRHMDLSALVAKTEDALRHAKNESDARGAMRRFLAAFGDAHLEISWPGVPAAAAGAPKQSVCQRLHYGASKTSPGVPFSTLPSYQPIRNADERYFPAGVLSQNGRRIGVLRIALFSEKPFGDLCEQALGTLHIAADAACDDDCGDHIEATTGNLLTAAMMRQLRALEQEKIDLLAVDLTGNGGGNTWCEPAARVLTSKKLAGAPYGFIRHPHWVSALRDDLAVVEGDLLKASDVYSKQLMSADSILKAAIDAAGTPCDLASIWENRGVDCSLVIDRPLFVTGILPYAALGSLPDLPSRDVLFSPNRYRYEEGVYRGALAILVDENTASSAERFTAMLRDNDAATVVGVPTAGAGCGYTNGGIPAHLQQTGADVKMPDCVQFRRDHTNAVEGITPDVLIAWRSYDAPYQRAARAAAALAALAAKR